VIFVLMTLGGIAQIFAWRLLAVRALSIWTSTVPALAACGAAALISDRVALSPKVSVPVAIVVGLVAGLALFAATRAFLRVASSSPTFRRATREAYEEQAGVSLPVAFVLSLGLAVPGEELFWRGLFQGKASQVFGSLGGALLAWACSVVVNASSGLMALAAGAVVGGAVWGGLAWWTHGVLASLVCHAVWTGLMLVRPPVPRRAGLRV
jgi:membrane protease YdiL (CAAX protease family)